MIFNIGKSGARAMKERSANSSCSHAHQAIRAKTRAKTYEFMQFFTQFQGLSGLSSLFFDEATLATWKESVDQIFSSFYLGTEYWTSTICSMQVEVNTDSIALVETPDGIITPAASVKAERVDQPDIETGNVSFFYKITYFVRNQRSSSQRPELKDQPLTFNLELGPNNIEVFTMDKSVEAGKSEKSGNDKPIVFASSKLFDKVCIKFKTPFYVLDATMRPRLKTEICDKISVDSGVATPFVESSKGSSSSGSSSSELNPALSG